MAYEEIDVMRLKNALITFKNSIDYSTSSNLLNSISNYSVWKSLSQTNLINSINKLINVRYYELNNEIDRYLQIVSKIEYYKSLQESNYSLESEYSNLSKNLYSTETYYQGYSLSKGKKAPKKLTRQVIDKNVEYQMNEINNRINENVELMNELTYKISSSI